MPEPTVQTPAPRSTEAAPPKSAPVAVGGRSGFNPVLDGIRGTAILLVMLYHMTVLNSTTPFDDKFRVFMGLGWVGVDLFFVLSGFLITGILVDAKGSANYFTNFYARRTLRIFPLYYAVVFVCLVIIPQVLPAILPHVVSPGASEVLMGKIDRFGNVRGYEHWFWLYLCNIPMAIHGTYFHGILGVTWSLAIEEQFYLVWPAVVFFCSRRWLVRVCVAVFGLALLWRLVLQFGLRANHVAVYVSTFSRMDALVAGALLAVMVRSPLADLSRMAGRARAILWTCTPAAIAIAVAETYGPHYDPEMGRGIGHTPVFLTIGLTLLSLSFGALLIMAVAAPRGSFLNRVFTTRALRTCGKYAYALYLFHQPVRAIFRDLLFGPMPSAMVQFPVLAGSQFPGQLIYYTLCIGATLVLAMVSWYCFESPLLKLKKYFPSGAEAAHNTPAAPERPASFSAGDEGAAAVPLPHAAGGERSTSA